MTSFAATVGQWAHAVEGALEAVFKESVQELASVASLPRSAGGRMRVDTGFLRASLMASTSQMPSINPAARPVDGATYVPDGQVELVILGADIGQTIYMGWTASYAAHREYGANGQPGDHFLETAAQQWPAIVDRTAAQVKSRLGL